MEPSGQQTSAPLNTAPLSGHERGPLLPAEEPVHLHRFNLDGQINLMLPPTTESVENLSLENDFHFPSTIGSLVPSGTSSRDGTPKRRASEAGLALGKPAMKRPKTPTMDEPGTAKISRRPPLAQNKMSETGSMVASGEKPAAAVEFRHQATCFRITGIPMVWREDDLRQKLHDIDRQLPLVMYTLSLFPDCNSTQTALPKLSNRCSDYFRSFGRNGERHHAILSRAAQTGVFDLDIRISNWPFIDVCQSFAAETGLKSRNVEKRINAV
jgi:hypothetical protein